MADRFSVDLASVATDRVLRQLLLVVVLLGGGLALTKHHADPDLWGHVQYGQDLLRYGLPATSTYSYTSVGHRWINHELLSELLLAWGVGAIGAAGLLVVKCGLGLGVLGGMIYRARRQACSETVAYGTALLVAVNLMHFWSLRPQLLSYLLFFVSILILDRALPAGATERRRLVWLLSLVPLFALWVNCHGGFVAGLCITAAYLAGRGLEHLRRDGRGAGAALTAMLLALGGAAAATLLNPYGWQLHHWLSRALGAPRPEIVEWLPPDGTVVWWPFWILAGVSVIAVAGTGRRRDYTQLLVLAITLWQACEHRRHIAFFALLVGLWLPLHFQSLLDRLQALRRSARRTSEPGPLGRAVLIGALLAVAGLLAGGLYGQLHELPVRRDGYPIAAFQFMADQRLQGKLVVRFKWAQYAIAAFGARTPEQPGMRVAFDGRFRTCYPQAVIDRYFDFAVGAGDLRTRFRSPQSPPVDPTSILTIGEPDLVLIGREQQNAVQVMQTQRAQWVLLYQDRIAQLYGRAARYGTPSSPHYIAPAQRKIGDQEQVGVATWPALPTPPTSPAASVAPK